MDLQSFIQSGLLEAYAMGQCSPQDRDLVERMIAEHPDLRDELASIELAFERFAAAQAVQPPKGVKDRILVQIGQDISAATAKTKPVASAPSRSKTALRTFQFLAFLLAAGCAFLLLQNRDLNKKQERVQFSADSLQQQLLSCNTSLQQPNPIAELLCDPATQRILISDGKGINAIVYYNPRLNRMAYDPQGLPEPKAGKYYQFWAIVGESPVSMGMKADNVCETLRRVGQAVAFAVSEEDNPDGNPAPTIVLAIGKV